MKSLREKITILIIVIMVPVGVILFFLNTLRYSIPNITADNYEKVLKRDSKQSLTVIAPYACAIFPDHYIFYTAKRYAVFPGYKRTVLDSTDRYVVNIKSLANNNSYNLEYADKNSDTLLSVSLTNPDNMGVIVNGKKIIDAFILSYDFTYMESEKRSHSDILVYQYDDYFLVGRVKSHRNNTFSSITFELYKRKMFFKSLE